MTSMIYVDPDYGPSARSFDAAAATRRDAPGSFLRCLSIGWRRRGRALVRSRIQRRPNGAGDARVTGARRAGATDIRTPALGRRAFADRRSGGPSSRAAGSKAAAVTLRRAATRACCEGRVRRCRQAARTAVAARLDDRTAAARARAAPRSSAPHAGPDRRLGDLPDPAGSRAAPGPSRSASTKRAGASAVRYRVIHARRPGAGEPCRWRWRDAPLASAAAKRGVILTACHVKTRVARPAWRRVSCESICRRCAAASLLGARMPAAWGQVAERLSPSSPASWREALCVASATTQGRHGDRAGTRAHGRARLPPHALRLRAVLLQGCHGPDATGKRGRLALTSNARRRCRLWYRAQATGRRRAARVAPAASRLDRDARAGTVRSSVPRPQPIAPTSGVDARRTWLRAVCDRSRSGGRPLVADDGSARRLGRWRDRRVASSF